MARFKNQESKDFERKKLSKEDTKHLRGRRQILKRDRGLASKMVRFIDNLNNNEKWIEKLAAKE